jgi:gamma-glutamylcyclotransferase (GGCT)/AIG2-like uncharacterized protein YtfP
MRFFFYGTLIAGMDNPVAQAVHARLRPLGAATVRGALHAIADPAGWYPALLPGKGLVRGALYETEEGFGAAELALLDSWEDFDPAAPAASLYRRDTVVASGPAGLEVEAQAYCWNQPLPADARPVPEGDFRAWLAEHGLAAFIVAKDNRA